MKIEWAFFTFTFFVSISCMYLIFKMQKWKWRCLLAEERLHDAEKNQDRVKETFQALSQDALEKNTHNFLEIAQIKLEQLQEKAKGDLEKRQLSIEQLVKPVKEGLTKLDQELKNLEKERKGEHATLKTHLGTLLEANKELSKETANLTRALRTPAVRGRWGEIQLRRVVEIAGMLNHCDFYEQQQEITIDQEILRPDLIVKLAGGRQVVIDAKVPLEAYLDSVQTENEGMRQAKLKEHAKLVRNHIMQLSKKAYHLHFTPTPEFVVLFLPSETFFSAALEYDPSLIEAGADQGVILSTPTTLIALLRAIAYGWKQENLSRYAEKVSGLGHELYKRIVDMNTHFSKMGRALSTAVEAYNKGIGSLETRVLVTARKFQEMGAAASSMDLDSIEMIEKIPREIESKEIESRDL